MTKTKLTPRGLPHGLGSLQRRRNHWWMVFSDPPGRQRQENTWTANREEAMRMLAERVLPGLKQRVELLEKIVHASPTKTGR